MDKEHFRQLWIITFIVTLSHQWLLDNVAKMSVILIYNKYIMISCKKCALLPWHFGCCWCQQFVTFVSFTVIEHVCDCFGCFCFLMPGCHCKLQFCSNEIRIQNEHLGYHQRIRVKQQIRTGFSIRVCIWMSKEQRLHHLFIHWQPMQTVQSFIVVRLWRCSQRCSSF